MEIKIKGTKICANKRREGEKGGKNRTCNLPAILRGEIQRGFSPAVADAGVASVLQQLCHHFRVPILCSTVQRRLVVLRLRSYKAGISS